MPIGADLNKIVNDFKQELALHPEGPGTTFPYTENYKETCFQTWYTNGMPSARQLVKLLPPDERGRTPSLKMLFDWIKLLGWRDRANELNQEVKKQLDVQYAETRIEMLKRHTDVGKQLQRAGIEYLLEHQPDKTGDAVKMVTEGVRIEKESSGLSEALEHVAKLKDTPLKELITQLVSRLPQEERLQLDTGINIIEDEEEIEDGEYSEMMPDDASEGTE